MVAREGRVLGLVVYEPLTRRNRFGAFRSLRAVEAPQVEAAVCRVMAEWQWSGPACLDFRRTGDGKLCLLDFNPRPWGNMRSLLGTGVNFPALLCRMALGETPMMERVLPAEYLSPGDGVRSLWARWSAQTGGTEGHIGRRRSGWSFVLRDPGLYLYMGILAAWERVVRH